MDQKEELQISDEEVRKRNNDEVTDKEGIPVELAQNSSIVTSKEVANYICKVEPIKPNRINYLYLHYIDSNNIVKVLKTVGMADLDFNKEVPS